MSRWFRMYDEVLDDPKVQRLSGDDFKAWANLLCLASRNDGALPCATDIAFALRLAPAKASGTIARLVSAGLLDPVDDRFAPHGWNERQYKSDVSTERVKRFRERSKTATVTPPDTETETDVPLDKSNGAKPVDEDVQFWSDAKSFLSRRGQGNPGALIGKWVKAHGKPETARALTEAQLERPADVVAFVEGCVRRQAKPEPVVPL